LPPPCRTFARTASRRAGPVTANRPRTPCPLRAGVPKSVSVNGWYATRTNIARNPDYGPTAFVEAFRLLFPGCSSRTARCEPHNPSLAPSGAPPQCSRLSRRRSVAGVVASAFLAKFVSRTAKHDREYLSSIWPTRTTDWRLNGGPPQKRKRVLRRPARNRAVGR
jgi:hypothetical protein